MFHFMVIVLRVNNDFNDYFTMFCLLNAMALMTRNECCLESLEIRMFEDNVAGENKKYLITNFIAWTLYLFLFGRLRQER
jgi:hypothetical protein